MGGGWGGVWGAPGPRVVDAPYICSTNIFLELSTDKSAVLRVSSAALELLRCVWPLCVACSAPQLQPTPQLFYRKRTRRELSFRLHHRTLDLILG